MKNHPVFTIKCVVGCTGITHTVVDSVCTCGVKITALHSAFTITCKSCGRDSKIPVRVRKEAIRLSFAQRFKAAGIRAAGGGSGAMIPI